MARHDYREEVSTAIGQNAPASDERVLRVIGDGFQTLHPLPARGELVIGRSKKSDVRIDHPSVSRQHAVLYLGPELRIEDLGSANGTRVRGRKLAAGSSTTLAMHDLVEIGELLLLVQPRPPTLDDATVGANAMDRVLALLDRVAPSPLAVLLLGETGVGKGVLAQRLHDRSPRARRPFLALNCAALPEALLESELFGHVKGAFTGAIADKPGLLESADGGTVFLDEVGELPPTVQVKLLTVLDTRRVIPVGTVKPRLVDVRFVAATNRDLEAEARSGAFRRDLFYRLSGLVLTIPPLRERVGEIEPLAGGIAAEAGAPPRFDDAALAALRAHPWPGNIRELRNVVQLAVVLADGGVIGAQHLGLVAPPPSPPPPAAESERQRILDALAATGANQKLAAQRLGMSRNTLSARMIEHGIPRPRKR